MLTPEEMREKANRLDVAEAATGPEDIYRVGAEICDRLDRTNALLELMFKILDQPLNVYTKEG